MIRLLFGAHTGPLSGLIRWTGGGHLSHVDIILPEGRLLGARADGVNIREAGYAPFHNVVRTEIPASERREAIFLDFAMDQLGKPYDNLALWAFLFNREWQDRKSVV